MKILSHGPTHICQPRTCERLIVFKITSYIYGVGEIKLICEALDPRYFDPRFPCHKIIISQVTIFRGGICERVFNYTVFPYDIGKITFLVSDRTPWARV